MTHELINLTLPFVVQEIENILNDYPEYPYQTAFSIHELRQKLIAYVLSQIPNKYTVIESAQSPLKITNFLYFPLEQRFCIQVLIHKGIRHLLRENDDWISRHIPQEKDSDCAPSHWFG